MPRVSCEGKDGAPTRSDLPGKLLPVCLALIQVEEGARLEFPGDIIRPTLSPQFWSALWSGFLSSPRLYPGLGTKNISPTSVTLHRGVAQRGRDTCRHTAPAFPPTQTWARGHPICLSATRAPPAYRSCSSPMWSMFRGFLRSDRIRSFISRPVWRFPRFCSA